MFDLDHPFFRPLYIRIVVVAVCVGWAAFELVSGGPSWAILFFALGVFAFYRLFVTFNPDKGNSNKENEDA